MASDRLVSLPIFYKIVQNHNISYHLIGYGGALTTNGGKIVAILQKSSSMFVFDGGMEAVIYEK